MVTKGYLFHKWRDVSDVRSKEHVSDNMPVSLPQIQEEVRGVPIQDDANLLKN